MNTVQTHLGIEDLKNLISTLFTKLKLDQNGDGKVSKSEVVTALFGLVPSLFGIGSVIDEVRDLDSAEITELSNYASKNFPDYVGINNDTEELIRHLIKVIDDVRVMFVLWHKVQANRGYVPTPTDVVTSSVETPATPPTPAEQKLRPGAQKQEAPVEEPQATDNPEEEAI